MEIANDEYVKIRTLIKDRELDEKNLDLAEELLMNLLKQNPKCSRCYGLLCEVYYWRGEESAMNKMAIYEKGVQFGNKGVELDPSNIESNFWLAVNNGLYGLEKGIVSSFFLLEPIETHFQKSLKIDESYFYGGPHRAIGWFYFQIPSWPISKGDPKKGLTHIRKALEYGPDFPLNHYYAARILLSMRNRKEANPHIEFLLALPRNDRYKREELRYKNDIQNYLYK
ncbi:MAG: hypothetical protein H7A24_02215 [Leptospiraceae bacterium]|nr:hypothetical protein [Leptospiraceae bacterium]MCP5510664.1 hypothetical protein [Leptospiraceae bacterium]